MRQLFSNFLCAIFIMLLVNKVFLILAFSTGVCLGYYNGDMDAGSEEAIASLGGICYNLQAITELIPNDTISAIISQHYLYDAKFRSGLDFITSPEFRVLSTRLANTNFYTYLLQQFRREGVDTTDISSLQTIFECVLLPLFGIIGDNVDAGTQSETAMLIPAEDFDYSEYDYDYETVEEEPERENPVGKKRVVVNRKRPYRVILSPRNLQSVVNEIVEVIPKDQVRDIIEANVARSTNFGKFYKVLRKSYFQAAVLKAIKAPGLAHYNKIFKQHNMSLKTLYASFFKILNYGPPI